MNCFIKIFLLNVVTITALFYAETQGALSLIVTNDASFLSILIMALYVCTSAFLGKVAYDTDVANKEAKVVLRKKLDTGHFVAEHLISLGLLGTIIGLCMATSNSLVESAPVNQIVAGLKEGLSIAFYTTMTGLVFSMLLQLQLLIITKELD
jgi:hypothetical protein